MQLSEFKLHFEVSVWQPSVQVHRVPFIKSSPLVLLSSSVLTLELYLNFTGQHVWNCFHVASDWKDPLQNRWGKGKREATLLHKHPKVSVGWKMEENIYICPLFILFWNWKVASLSQDKIIGWPHWSEWINTDVLLLSFLFSRYSG